jgi:hypothetical protein
MTIARDVLAETNPAFCCAVFAEFCLAYKNAQKEGRAPSVILSYLILPIVIAEEFALTFEGCNKDTGLSVWLNRNPQIITELSKKINSTLDITTTAIQFGSLTGALHLTSDGDLASALKKLPAIVAGSVFKATLSRARLFGTWTATMGSPRAVLEAFGVSV